MSSHFLHILKFQFHLLVSKPSFRKNQFRLSPKFSSHPDLQFVHSLWLNHRSECNESSFLFHKAYSKILRLCKHPNKCTLYLQPRLWAKTVLATKNSHQPNST